MSADPLFAGIDLGTSGARACLIDSDGRVQAEGRAALADYGEANAPDVWAAACDAALAMALRLVNPRRVVALAVDGTSGTMLAVDQSGAPLGAVLMYNEPCPDDAILARIAGLAPATSAAHGATSGLARALTLQRVAKVAQVLHQADWQAFRLSGRWISDANNALKTGYDPVMGRWPDWIARTGMSVALLPQVMAPGSVVGPVTAQAAARFGLDPSARVVAGTTDGCASFLATGACLPGEAVTALGTTLTLKILSDTPIFAPESGIYSHRLLGNWLAGGASNSGGAALLQHFSAARIAELSARIDPDHPLGLNYYPLPKPGERFPVAGPALPPCISPRPESDVDFLQGLLEGIAAIEALGYRKLAELGAAPLVSVRSVGGGARNPGWTAIRQRLLGVPMAAAVSEAAAYGTAVLARHGALA